MKVILYKNPICNHQPGGGGGTSINSLNLFKDKGDKDGKNVYLYKGLTQLITPYSSKSRNRLCVKILIKITLILIQWTLQLLKEPLFF